MRVLSLWWVYLEDAVQRQREERERERVAEPRVQVR
jgi:hypothetical protein